MKDRRDAWAAEEERALARLRAPLSPSAFERRQEAADAAQEARRDARLARLQGKVRAVREDVQRVLDGEVKSAGELDPASLARQVKRYPWEHPADGESNLPPRVKR